MGLFFMKCEKLLQDTNNQYKRIIDALEEFKRGQISSKELNVTTFDAFNRVDNSIKKYEKQ